MAPRTVPAGLRPDRLADDLARLGSLDEAGLRRRWRAVFGKAAPNSLGRAMLLRALAYRVQSDALGGLDRETARALDRMAGPGADVIPLPALPDTKPGTLLLREWQGQQHRVMVMENGFAWNGSTYDSLSKVAHAITGTRWSGPRFFGLREAGR